MGIFFFIVLPQSKKIKTDNYLPFLLLALVVFYEDLGSYTNIDQALNQKIHEWLFDVPFKGWNLWVFNIFNYHVSKILFLLIIHNQVKRKAFRATIQGLWIFYLSISIGLQWSGIEPVHTFQPIIYFLGNSFLIIASGLFFIDLITSDYYMDYNPLKMWSFWFNTLSLFQVSLAFLSEVSFEYLASQNKNLFYSLNDISQFLYISILASIMVKLAAEALSFSKKNQFQHA
jgi:hypothetical protein